MYKGVIDAVLGLGMRIFGVRLVARERRHHTLLGIEILGSIVSR